jgi:hypothetical protein
MQTEYTGYIDRAEWRWVTLVSLTLIFFVFSPFLIIAFQNPLQSHLQFMGALHDYTDSAADIARMRQGAEAELLLQFLYTPDEHSGALVHPIYALLGRLTVFAGQSPSTIYHVVRVFSALLMYLTIYHLGASIWVKVRTRRIFFIIASVGSGFGWLVALLTGLPGGLIIPDLMIPQAFPIYASAANVHYPLTIACLALLASVLIPILRPGGATQPSPENGAAVAFMGSLLLAFIYPDALLPLGLAFIISVGVYWYSHRHISPYEWQWGLWLLVPALPVITYDILTAINNNVVAAWLRQRGYEVPSFPMLLIALGLPLLISIPGLIRAFRRFEADGDRFMLLWLLAMIILMYLPLQLNQYLIVGLMLPLAYFATRSIEDFWFTYIKRRFRARVYILVIPAIVLSHVMWLFLPIFPLISGWHGMSKTLLEQDYSSALLELNQRATPNDVILASPELSIWIPSWTGAHTVYGHPAETLDADARLADVRHWYQASDSSDEICLALLEDYHVDYVLVGQLERRLAGADGLACVQNLTALTASDTITIYITPFTASR